jgi:putative phage-type endonuclease
MTDEDWLRYRKRGIGASEVGTILGLNPYKASIELFYEKLGEDLNLNVENLAQFMGKEQEDFVANLWQYWDPSDPQPGAMINNYREKRVIRRCQRVNAYVHNPKYPWLFVSLDRKINHSNRNETPKSREDRFSETGVSYIGEGALEIKTIAGWEADKWEAGIPPSHVVQVQTQLLVCEFEFGELATLTDGRQFDVLPFERRQDIMDTILTRTKDFWDRVEKARAAMTRKFEGQRTFNYRMAQEAEAELAELEPSPDGSDAFAAYLKKKYNLAEPGEVIGGEEQLNHAETHRKIQEQIKALEGQKQYHENILKNSIRSEADKLTFGDRGFVSWRVDSRGSRRFLNKVKT